jgi:indolepyruvate ferredoxin oxidoreductase beta subunit
MKSDIILSGVGGQGILSIAATIGIAALENNLYLKQAEVHGMSQRGGAVQSHLRISEKEIASDLIPLGKADLIISVEPMESLRYLPWLSENGWLVTNTILI